MLLEELARGRFRNLLDVVRGPVLISVHLVSNALPSRRITIAVYRADTALLVMETANTTSHLGDCSLGERLVPHTAANLTLDCGAVVVGGVHARRSRTRSHLLPGRGCLTLAAMHASSNEIGTTLSGL